MVRNRSKSKLQFIANGLLVLASVILIVGIGISLVQLNSNSQKHTPLTQNNPAPSTDKPSDENFTSHQVAPDQPRYISIPAISVNAMVKSAGVNTDNQIIAPDNVYETAWYNGSAKPGQTGAALISGHVSSWETHGVFYDLKLLKPGDQISVERGDGTKLNYTVTKTETYDANNVDMQAALAPINPNKSGLNLITCAGEVIDDTNQFNKRMVIFAEQI